MVSQPGALQPPGVGRMWNPSIGDILCLPRMEFLSIYLFASSSPTVSADIMAGSRASTLRQYQSTWKAFQRLLPDRHFTTMSSSVVLEFVSHMFHVRGRAARTVSSFVSTLADPLRFSSGLTMGE